MSKRTVIVGATPNPNRYAFLAAHQLVAKKQEIIPLGIKQGIVADHSIIDLRTRPKLGDVDTITLYLGVQHQAEWEDYLLSLKPHRIIFNPGTENPSFEQKANAVGIETLNACTLVLLSTGQY